MALYKNSNFILQSSSDAFDKIFKPGETPEHSGIYRCEGCTKEIVAEHGRSFPSQNHQQHTSVQGSIRWRLIVFAQHNPT